MYCPKCSQLQPSDEIRFCKRCGFQLDGVAMLIKTEGSVQQPTGGPGQTLPSSRKKIMTEGAIFTGVTWVVAIIATFWFDAGGGVESLAKIAALLFFILGLIGLIRFLYGFLFVKDLADQTTQNAFANTDSQDALGGGRHAALPPQREPASDYSRRGNTKEMVPQPSVTENTTRLLEEPTDQGN